MSRKPASTRVHRASAPPATAWIPLLAALLLLALGGGGCRDSREGRLAEIRSLQGEGQFDASIAPLRVFLTTDPSHSEANYRLGAALVQTGRPSLAIWHLQKAMEDPAYRTRAGLLLSSTLLATQSFEEAIRVADEVLAAEPQRVAALNVRARAKIAAGRPEEALADADHLLELRPKEPAAYALRVGALIDLERFEEAEQLQIKLKELTEESGEQDKAARACAGLGVFYAGRSLQQQAEAAYDDCLEKYPVHPVVLQLATDYLVEVGKADKAIEVWRKSVAAAPEEIDLRANLVDLLHHQGLVEEAEAELKKTVEHFDSSPAWRMLGVFYRRVGRIHEARQALEKALEQASGEAPALRFALAEALIAEGEYERAEEIAADLEEPSYRNLLQGAILLAQRRPEEALEQLEAGIRLWPNNAGARYLAGRAAQSAGDLKRALAEYREAIRVDETATDAALAMARIHFSLGKYALAQQFAERHIRARPFVSADAHVIAVRSAIELRLYPKAERILEHLEARPGYQTIAVLERAALLRRRDGPEAELELLQGAPFDLTDPANAAVLSALAQALTRAQKMDAALAKVRAAVAAHPEEPAFLNLQARLLARLGRDAEARTALEKALAADPAYAPALEVLGAYADQEGDRSAALAYFDRAAAADPTNPDYAYRAAQMTLLMKRLDETAERLRKIVALNPGHVGACNDLAWLLADKGEDLDFALEAAQRAVQLDRSPATLDTLGWVKLKRGEAEAAAKAFARALELKPESPSLRYRLALAQAALGDSEAAVANLSRALSEDFPEAEAARAELARLQGG